MNQPEGGSLDGGNAPVRVPLGKIARILNGGTPSPDSDNWGGDIPWATPVDLNLADGLRISATGRSLTVQGLKTGSALAPKGSVLLSTRAPIGYVSLTDAPTAFNQGCKAIVPGPNVHGPFLLRLIQASRADLVALGQGSTFQELSTSALKSYAAPLPDWQRQVAVAQFLDRETGTIDAFIQDQEELVVLLRERRAAAISQAVTKGLNPHTPMTETGVPWLGLAPNHWTPGRLRDAVRSSKNGLWGDEPDGLADIRCIRVADFDRSRQRVHDRDVTMRSIRRTDLVGRTLRRGDLLLEKSGGGEKSPVGFVVMFDSNESAVTSNFVARISLRTDMDPAFWTYVHGFFYERRLTQRSLKQSTGIQNLDASSYLAERVQIPPLEEQQAISSYLEETTGKLDASITDARHAISLLRERRSALISAAVTGKIDVQEYVRGVTGEHSA
jgi:type I restriction enzyme S subunit